MAEVAGRVDVIERSWMGQTRKNDSHHCCFLGKVVDVRREDPVWLYHERKTLAVFGVRLSSTRVEVLRIACGIEVF